MFRDGMVSGSVLLSLTDADLEVNGVSNSLHRRAIIFAIKQMADAHHAAKGGSSSAMLQRSLSSSEANKPKFDVCAALLMFSNSYIACDRCRIPNDKQFNNGSAGRPRRESVLIAHAHALGCTRWHASVTRALHCGPPPPPTPPPPTQQKKKTKRGGAGAHHGKVYE
jgi:hypothetical protein